MSNPSTAVVNICAIVTAEVDVGSTESIDDLECRTLDIYLHGPYNDCMNKEDLGADSYKITTKAEEQNVIVNKGLLLALLNTANRTTDLDSIYDDQYGTSYDWEDLPKLVSGLLSEDLDRFKPV